MIQSNYKDKNGTSIKEGDLLMGCPSGWKEPRQKHISKVEWTGDSLQVHSQCNGYDFMSPLAVWLKVSGCGFEEVVAPSNPLLARTSTENQCSCWKSVGKSKDLERNVLANGAN